MYCNIQAYKPCCICTAHLLNYIYVRIYDELASHFALLNIPFCPCIRAKWDSIGQNGIVSKLANTNYPLQNIFRMKLSFEVLDILSKTIFHQYANCRHDNP